MGGEVGWWVGRGGYVGVGVGVSGVRDVRREMWMDRRGANLPLYYPQPNAIPQRLQPVEHRLPRLLLVDGGRAAQPPRAAERPPRDRAARIVAVRGEPVRRLGRRGAGPFFLPRREVRGYAVGHGDQLDHEQVEACGVEERVCRVDVGGGRVGGGLDWLRHFGGRVEGVWLEGSKQWVRRGGGEVCACGGVDREQRWVVWEVVRMMYVE